MRFGYVLIAVLVALVVGFAVGALTAGDGDEGSVVTRPDGATGKAESAGGTGGTAAQTPTDEGSGSTETDPGQGTELAPESASDPRPVAPDDVIGERPGGGGAGDGGQ